MAEKEYIEREEVFEMVDILLDESATKSVRVAIDMFKRLLSEIPIADVAPVKHGHWIYKERNKLVSTGIARVAEGGVAVNVKKHITVKVPYCSICGERGGDDKLDATPFCPDCGARMDGDADASSNDNKTPEISGMIQSLQNSNTNCRRKSTWR